MSRTICSWCQNPLVLKDDILVCSNTDCPACDEKYLHEELIRTRRALDVALDGLTTIGGYLDYNDCVGIALDTKDEIYKVLEQKDVK